MADLHSCGYVVATKGLLIGAEKILHLSKRSGKTTSPTLAGYALALAGSRPGQPNGGSQMNGMKHCPNVKFVSAYDANSH
jgi:hypothetical protein